MTLQILSNYVLLESIAFLMEQLFAIFNFNPFLKVNSIIEKFATICHLN